MEKIIGNNGRNIGNNAQQQHHGLNSNHGMNRQQQPRSNHHYNHQQQQPNPGQQRRMPPQNSQQQQRGQIQRQPQNPNMGQPPNRNVNSANMNNQNRMQRPGGQQQQHHSHPNNMNNNHNRPQQQQRPGGQHNPQSRQMNPNAQRQGNPGQQRPNPNSQQRPGQQGVSNGTNGPSTGPPPPQVLPKGWKKEEVVRTKGISAGIVDVVYAPNSTTADLPAGKKFRSKLELHKYFGTRYDMALLDYRSGKLSQVNWRKARRMKSLAVNNTNYASAAKYDNYLNLPIRQTASIFKQSVAYRTNNHKNEAAPASVTNQAANKTGEKPKPVQLFWEMRFNNLRAVYDRDLCEEYEDLNHEIELKNIPKFKSFPVSNENVLRSVAASWYLNQSKSLLGQEKEFAKNARIFIDREQPLIPQTAVKENEIKLQEQKLKQIRKKIQQALKEVENMDYITLEEIEQAEQENLDHEEVDLDKDQLKMETKATVNQSEELIVL
jgi:hypothetical protein